MEKITLKDIQKAESVLQKILSPTPLIRNEWLSLLYGCEVYLKLEIAQPVGSFKIRGATYRISALSEEDKKVGVIAASAGNHAQGVAWGARYYHTSSLIVMPETAPLTKISNTQALGAQVHLEGENYDESFLAAQRIIGETGRIYVHAFHDPMVIAGQGTTGLEILSQLPDVDYVVASMGGGGLCAGLGTVLKALKPSVKLIGCQSENASSMAASISRRGLVEKAFKSTFATALRTFKHVRRRFDERYYSVESGIRVIDDYGHHPTEVKAVLATAKQTGYSRMITLFQPHRYSRTKLCWNEFLACFEGTDILVLLPIYAASEDPLEGISSHTLAQAIRLKSQALEVIEIASLEEALNWVEKQVLPGDLILTLGAGSITKLGDLIAKQLS